jgi:hypothetical protein
MARAFKHWHGGSRWHYLYSGYHGHIVQVVDDFGDLVAVAGRLSLKGAYRRKPVIF